MHYFLSAKFHKIWTQHVDRCCGENFRNRILKIFTIRVFFSKKCKNFLTIFNILRVQATMTLQWSQIAGNLLPKISFYGISSYHFYYWNQLKVILLACTPSTSAGSQSPLTIESRDTRPRRMQEVKNLSTNIRALWAEYCIVGIPHNTAI